MQIWFPLSQWSKSRFGFMAPGFTPLLWLIGVAFVGSAGQTQEMVKDCHQRRLRGETFQSNYDFRLVDKAGNVTWVEVNAVLISSENKPATLNFLVDITERKRSDMALRNQMEFLETMINTIPTPIYYKDSQGVYQGCNMQYASMIIGLPKERIIGRTVLDLSETIPPDLAQRCHTQDMELIHMPGFRVYDEAISCPWRHRAQLCLQQGDLYGFTGSCFRHRRDNDGHKRAQTGRTGAERIRAQPVHPQQDRRNLPRQPR